MTDKIQVLYRYRHLQGEHREWTRKIITDSMLHFTNPSALNDPFDCKVHFRSSCPVQELKQQHLERIKKRMGGLNRQQRRAMASRDIKTMKTAKFQEGLTERLQNTVNSVGILSFSKTDRNILLWSHYAAGHSGLCLTFTATNHSPFFGRALPVMYKEVYPDLSMVSSVDEHIDAFLLTKAMDWSYEEEYRIIDHDDGPGDKVFPSELLLAVTLGARMPPTDKQLVSGWANSRKSPIEIFESFVVPGEFSLGIRQYEG